MIRLDISPASIVITCDDCPHWSAIQLDRSSAENSGAQHESLVHPELWEFRARLAERATRRRRATARGNAMSVRTIV